VIRVVGERWLALRLNARMLHFSASLRQYKLVTFKVWMPEGLRMASKIAL
jgi:hypothetical protein